ncbi:hypothetical protein LP421_29785 [Rhizobium sp. RCAM05350]|nr:hypothetical protein LP421_29785 [Rhizobium sp. RCAM05350]
MSNWKRNAKAAISAMAFLGVSAAMAYADSFRSDIAVAGNRGDGLVARL